MHAAAAEGRPLWGALVKPVFAAAGTIDNLRFVRLVTVLGIVALACLLYWALVRSKVGRLPAALIALLVCTMPPFQLYAAWSVAFSVPWTALLAGTSSLLAVGGMDAPRHRFDRLVWAIALLVAACLIYQPAAMFFWVFFAIALVGAVTESGRVLRLAKRHFAVAATAAVAAYVGYRICIWLVGPDAPGADRGTVTRDIAGKAEWFAHWALYGALNLFDVTWSAWGQHSSRRSRREESCCGSFGARAGPGSPSAWRRSSSRSRFCRASWSRRPTSSRPTGRCWRSRG